MHSDSTETSGYDRALIRAAALARRKACSAYVVNAGEGEYAVATDDDLDTWWQGATVVAEFEPDGTLLI